MDKIVDLCFQVLPTGITSWSRLGLWPCVWLVVLEVILILIVVDMPKTDTHHDHHLIDPSQDEGYLQGRA